MPGDILTSIDGALADYATSKDAMRWTPEGKQPPVSDDACPYCGLDHPPDGPVAFYSLNAEAASEFFTVLGTAVAEAGRELVRELAPVIDAMAGVMLQFAADMETVEAARRTPISAMHSEYHRRRKARGRRKR